jgi:polyisoprenoid-binding protein YceI
MIQSNNLTDTKWTIDAAHSSISFKVSHLMISNVRGVFKVFDASIYTTGKDFTTAQIDLWIDATSIDTGDEKRDEHLNSAEFFDIKNFKQITFTSQSIEKPDKHGNHEMWGELTMKGITKVIQLNVRFGGIVNDPWGVERAGFTVTGKINRNGWGLTWNKVIETGGIMVGEEVRISCEIELVNAGAKDTVLVMEKMTTDETIF